MRTTSNRFATAVDIHISLVWPARGHDGQIYQVLMAKGIEVSVPRQGQGEILTN